MSKQYEAEKAVHGGHLMRSLPHRRRGFTGSTLLICCYSEREKDYIKQKRQLSKAVLIERWSVLLEQYFV